MSVFMFVLGTVQLLIPACLFFGATDIKKVSSYTTVVFIIVLILGIVYANTGHRLEK